MLTYMTKPNTKKAVLPVGYWDGIPRSRIKQY